MPLDLEYNSPGPFEYREKNSQSQIMSFGLTYPEEIVLLDISRYIGLIWQQITTNNVAFFFYLNLKIIIIIIIMSCPQHGYPWLSLATSPYQSSLLAGLQGYIPYPHIAAVCMFELVVLLLLGHMRGSKGVHHWWVRPCFSSCVLRVWFV